MNPTGRAGIVTGAGRGIGAVVARALAREGVCVLAVSRTQTELENVCAAIRAEGGTASAFAADVGQDGSAAGIVAECERIHGAPDVLVNAAGVQRAIGHLADVDMREWWNVLEINLRGTVQLCAAVLPSMMRRGQGVIINFSGGGATGPRPRFTAYATSKAAVVRFTESLAEEVREAGITVNAIAPGAVDTRMQDDVLDAGPRAGPEYERMRRLRESGAGGVPPELAADLAVSLATGRTGRLTGKLISAPHDDWREWTRERIAELAGSEWLTLRRLDRHTVERLASRADVRT